MLFQSPEVGHKLGCQSEFVSTAQLSVPTIVSRLEEDVTLRKWSFPRYCCASCILETKTKVGSTAAKAPALRTNPKIDEAPTAPKPTTHPSHPQTPRPSTPSSSLGSTSSSILPFYRHKAEGSPLFFYFWTKWVQMEASKKMWSRWSCQRCRSCLQLLYQRCRYCLLHQ
jgi:hypothetical protein